MSRTMATGIILAALFAILAAARGSVRYETIQATQEPSAGFVPPINSRGQIAFTQRAGTDAASDAGSELGRGMSGRSPRGDWGHEAGAALELRPDGR